MPIGIHEKPDWFAEVLAIQYGQWVVLGDSELRNLGEPKIRALVRIKLP